MTCSCQQPAMTCPAQHGTHCMATCCMSPPLEHRTPQFNTPVPQHHGNALHLVYSCVYAMMPVLLLATDPWAWEKLRPEASIHLLPTSSHCRAACSLLLALQRLLLLQHLLTTNTRSLAARASSRWCRGTTTRCYISSSSSCGGGVALVGV